MSIPVIAIVGRPNVGKSTLFNVLTQSRDALVYDKPGVTRDRIFGEGRLLSDSQEYLVIDTGGINGDEQGIDAAMAEQALKAADECDIVFWLVDARAGLTPIDEVIANQLRGLNKPVVIVANKIDGLNPDLALAEFYALGMGEPYAIAAAHKRGVNGLLEAVFRQYLPDYGQENNEAENDVDINDFEKLELTYLSDQDIAASGLNSELDDFGLDDLELDDLELDDRAEAREVVHVPVRPKLDPKIKVAIIGRPNVGKSTLVNRLLGEERVVVYDQPGTTIDSIYIPFKRRDRDYVLIDTAGVRKKGRISEVIEKFSIVKTLKAIKDANVVVLLIDSTEQLVEQDMHLLSYAKEQGRSLIIACNKWDGLDIDHKEDVKRELDRRLSFVNYAKIFFISAKFGSNVGLLWDSINNCFDSVAQDCSTARLTKMLEQAVHAHQPPLVRGRRVKLRYAHLGSNYPYTIVIHGKQTESLPSSYKRYLANFFQEKLKLFGTPVLLAFKTDDNPYAGIRNKLTPRQLYKRQRMIKHRKISKK